MSSHPIKGAVNMDLSNHEGLYHIINRIAKNGSPAPVGFQWADAGTELVGGEAMLRTCMEPHASGFGLTIENDEFKIVISYRCPNCPGI